MNRQNRTYEWLSAHLFYSGTARQFLCSAIRPVIDKVSHALHPESPYFFIRYAEEGLHIRLRLHVRIDELLAVRTALETIINGTGTVIKYVPYVPETKRYGNELTLPLAEGLFHASAVCSLEYITTCTEWDVQTALAVACKINVAFFHALNEPPKVNSHICNRFIDAWLSHLGEKNATSGQLKEHMLQLYNKQAYGLQQMTTALWKQLQSGQAAPVLQTYMNRCRPLLEAYRKAHLPVEKWRYAMRSLLHMTHNRLGISNREEAWSLFIVEKCLHHLYEQPI